MTTKETSVVVRFYVVNLFGKIYELRAGSGIGVCAPQFGQRVDSTARSPTIFEEFNLIMSQRGGKPSCLGQCWFGTARNGAAWKVLAKPSARKQNRARCRAARFVFDRAGLAAPLPWFSLRRLC
jgi:hypothetical protein